MDKVKGPQIPVTIVIAVALGIVLVTGLLAFVKPKWDEGKALDDEIANLEAELIDIARPSDTLNDPRVEIHYADLFQLAKAMPDAEDMPGIILELDAVSEAAGVEFLAMTPLDATSTEEFQRRPIELAFDGNYYDLTDFLYRLRSLVSVRNGQLAATGRLYALEGLDLHASQDGFPRIEASLTLVTYIFGAGPMTDNAIPAAAAPEPATPNDATEQSDGGSETSDDPQSEDSGSETPEESPDDPDGSPPEPAPPADGQPTLSDPSSSGGEALKGD